MLTPPPYGLKCTSSSTWLHACQLYIALTCMYYGIQSNFYQHTQSTQIVMVLCMHALKEFKSASSLLCHLDKAKLLTETAKGKHHIGDFLPPDELEKFIEKVHAKKEGREAGKWVGFVHCYEIKINHCFRHIGLQDTQVDR